MSTNWRDGKNVDNLSVADVCCKSDMKGIVVNSNQMIEQNWTLNLYWMYVVGILRCGYECDFFLYGVFSIFRHCKLYIVHFVHLCLTFSSQSLCTFISAASKFAQLQCLWRSKDAGQVSALTWALATFTCASKAYLSRDFVNKHFSC